jgi:hypothetical protein
LKLISQTGRIDPAEGHHPEFFPELGAKAIWTAALKPHLK